MKISLRDLFFGMACGLGFSMYFVVDMAETIEELRSENVKLYESIKEYEHALGDDTTELL